MDNKNYLNEQKYQKTAKKVNNVSNMLLGIGIPMVIFGTVMAFGFHKIGTFIFAVLGMACVGFGLQAKMIGKGREITAFMAQQQIPVAKEGMEKMSPAMGTAAKEIAKGVKEGLNEADKEVDDEEK